MGVVLALALAGCSSKVTQLMVVVNSDLQVPTELSSVRVSVANRDGIRLTSHEFQVVPRGAKTGPDEHTLPLSFAVTPPEDDADQQVSIEVSAVLTTSVARALFSRRAVTGFIKGKSLLLPMYLA